MIDEEYIPMTKKMKRDPEIRAIMKQEGNILQFSDGPYAAQVTLSVIWTSHLLYLYSNIGVQYPPVVAG
jgi:hypothetical protein